MVTGEKTGLSCNHDSRKTDPESEAFTCKQRFLDEGRWGSGKAREAQDASAGSGSGHLEIPSDILNDRKLSERVCASGE